MSGKYVAVYITASHNPPTDNGFKVRDPNGGAIDPDGLKRIEALIPDSVEETKRVDISKAMRDKKVIYFDASEAYTENIKKLVDLQKIKDAGFTVMVDLRNVGQRRRLVHESDRWRERRRSSRFITNASLRSLK